MEPLMRELKAWGCDTEGALERFLDDVSFYQSCLGMVAEDPGFEALGKALKEEQVSEAFDCAHTLKGVLANAGLTPMYDITVRIVEPLRAGNMQNLMPAYEELLISRAYLKQLLKKNGEGNETVSG